MTTPTVLPSRRPSVDDVLLHTAYAWASRSTCPNLHVGAVISVDGRILATGYNGAPAGFPHCTHAVRQPGEPAVECQSVHAEANAIAWAARYGTALAGSQLTTTDTPCLRCAQLIVQVGITRVVAGQRYRDPAGWQLLLDAHLEVRVLDE